MTSFDSYILLAALLIGAAYGAYTSSDEVPESYPPVQIMSPAEHTAEEQITTTETGYTSVYASSVNTSDGYEYRELAGDGSYILLCNNENASDPTYDQLIEFLQADSIDQVPYRDDAYVCADYARDLHDNAEKAGYRAGWVGLDFTSGKRHACNVFDTVDRGIVYVDCTGQQDPCMNYDCVVEIVPGEEYTPVYLFEGEFESDSMGTVDKFIVYW